MAYSNSTEVLNKTLVSQVEFGWNPQNNLANITNTINVTNQTITAWNFGIDSIYYDGKSMLSGNGTNDSI